MTALSLPRNVRGTHKEYPVESVMIAHLVSYGIKHAGWLSSRNLRRAYDKMTSEFFMNRGSTQFWRKWYQDGRTSHRDLV